VVDADYLSALTQLVEPFGITHTGVTTADVLSQARKALHDRLDAGFDDGMQFTFRNPERSTDPQRAVHDARTVFVAARPYLLDDPAISEAVDGPVARVARYAWMDHYAPLREGLWAVARQLRSDGFAAVPFADDNSIVDRDVAHRAGLGWFGKNANLLIPGAGSWFVLGSVVTTAPLPISTAVANDGCGTCTRCIVACPTGAIVAPGVIDGGRCLAWQLQKPGVIPVQFRAAIGDRIYGCDDCQDSCPPTVHLGVRHRATVAADQELRSTVSVLQLLRGDDAEVFRIWGRWYLADRDARWVRRNALVVLGNSGDTSDPVRAVLADYVADHDPMLRAHAVWAIRRLGLLDLMPLDDPDPLVRTELTAPLEGHS